MASQDKLLNVTESKMKIKLANKTIILIIHTPVHAGKNTNGTCSLGLQYELLYYEKCINQTQLLCLLVRLKLIAENLH